MQAPSVPVFLIRLAMAVVLGFAGGSAAKTIGAPLPWMLGAFLASAVVSLTGVSLFGLTPDLPMPIRNAFVAVIGVMIGGTFHAGTFASMQTLWIPILAVGVFVLAAWSMNYVLFRQLGHFDRATAFFAGMPGGLVEAIAIGERSGADVAALSLQQFARIALVITTVPFIFFIWRGEAVGSAAGMTLAKPGTGLDPQDALILLSCAIAGFYGGKLIRLPAHILTGPLVLSAVAHLLGLTDATPPGWIIATAQVFVGTGLGARFRGFRLSRVFTAFWLAAVSVSLMLALGAGIVLILRLFIETPFDVLFISFAPGGVTETALIALSLHASPVFVTTLHVFRIFFTVILSSFAARRIGLGTTGTT
jgi:membrane AbrB-like protein